MIQQNVILLFAADQLELLSWSLGLPDKSTARAFPHLDFYRQILNEGSGSK